jgi:RNA polymerase sigma-70 factor (ECF subfamily)
MSRQAQGHDRTPEDFRAYLRLLARLQPEPGLRGKIDMSGVVQQTVLEAYEALDQFQALNEDQQRAWLRRILAHNLTDEVRKLRTARRDVGRERSLEAALEESSARPQDWLAADQSSPSERASRAEEFERLAQALEKLTEGQHTAVELHYWKALSLAEIAQQMGQSKESVAKLLQRGIARLHALLAEESRD